MSNQEIVDCVYMTLDAKSKSSNLHTQCGVVMDMIIKSSLMRKTLDNVTGILIAFQNFENYFQFSVKSNKTSSVSSQLYNVPLLTIKNEDNKFSSLNNISNKKGLLTKKKENRRIFNSEDFKSIEGENKGRSIDNIQNICDSKAVETNCSFINKVNLQSKKINKNIVINLQDGSENKKSLISFFGKQAAETTNLGIPLSCRNTNRKKLELN